jgi:hypothetical protein
MATVVSHPVTRRTALPRLPHLSGDCTPLRRGRSDRGAWVRGLARARSAFTAAAAGARRSSQPTARARALSAPPLPQPPSPLTAPRATTPAAPATATSSLTARRGSGWGARPRLGVVWGRARCAPGIHSFWGRGAAAVLEPLARLCAEAPLMRQGASLFCRALLRACVAPGFCADAATIAPPPCASQLYSGCAALPRGSTNNEAEYCGLIAGLEVGRTSWGGCGGGSVFGRGPASRQRARRAWGGCQRSRAPHEHPSPKRLHAPQRAVRLGAKHVVAEGDSQLVVRQVRGSPSRAKRRRALVCGGPAVGPPPCKVFPTC